MSAKKYTLLLTACITPGNMIYTSLVDADTRRTQYVEALEFYLQKTDLPLVFVENTGNDISEPFKEYIEKGRMEYLTFCGNDFDKNRGKGYGEMGIMEYAVAHSMFLQSTDFIVKVTGRLKIINIKTLLNIHKYYLPVCDIQCVLNVKDRCADSRLFISTLAFLQNHFFVKKEMINDAEGMYLEHILFNSIDQQNVYAFFPFFLRPVISGISGTSGQPYWEGNYRIKLSHLQEMLECSIQYNLGHEYNTSGIICRILKVMNWGVGICNSLLELVKCR